ncbi:hypothetical protein Pcinc_044173 [Petrolisthes cinctipes]|uniref:Uncharacterized protein n=1 Tax=Petrolisthes cinctipes TaxID=88211 RepID=A0AAE1EH63_PETCI|nr:hypothetical protein Pcinc_044173 [Petrolisthes cinctipes]
MFTGIQSLVGASFCVLLWLTVDNIEWQVGQEMIRKLASPSMTGECPPQERSVKISNIVDNKVFFGIMDGLMQPNITQPDMCFLDGLKATLHIHPFTWKGGKNGKQVYDEDGDIQVKVVIANGRLYHMTNTSLYTAAETKFQWIFSDILETVEMVGNLLREKPFKKPFPIKTYIDMALAKLPPSDTQTPHMEMLKQSNYTTLLELPAIRIANTSYTFPPLPELSFTYDGSGPTAAGGIKVERYWTRNLFRKDILCNFMNQDQMHILNVTELYMFSVSPLDTDPHPLVTANLSVPSGRALTLDLHPVLGINIYIQTPPAFLHPHLIT